MHPQITWENFSIYNNDARGVRFKFEDLSRQLFARENLSENIQNKYLHSNPNNYGLETEPILNKKTGKRLGFQAKYFESNVRYDEIEESVKKIIKYYKGKIDIVYLYSNKAITSTAKAYQKIIHMLELENIHITLITDATILDLVHKYPDLGLYYFGNHSLDVTWFETQAERAFEKLGKRYNPDFNVSTQNFDELSLFVQNKRAAELLNAKKVQLAKQIDKLYENWYVEDREYLDVLKNKLQNLANVSPYTLANAASWKSDINQAVMRSRESLISKKKDLEIEAEKQYTIMQDNEAAQEKRDSARGEYRIIQAKLQTIDKLLALPETIEISPREQQLIQGDVLAISGLAGTGKTQLLAHELKEILKEDNSENNKRVGLLLSAEIYLSDAPIEQQIMQGLKLDYSFDELLEILEVIGEKDNQIVPVFIDALNETWLKKLWEIGLSDIIRKVESLPHVKLAFSYRPEYEKIICNDAVLQKIQQGKILRLRQNGFVGDPFTAVQAFLNYYHIPFTPVEYFYTKLENPLFLTLYCQTYRDGEDVSLPSLYERLLNNANKNLYKQQGKILLDHGYSEEDNILNDLINEISLFMVKHHKKYIAKTDLCNLSYWRNYDLPAAVIIGAIKKEGILQDTISANNEEVFHFSYDQMNDYYLAKAIINEFKDEESLRQYLQENILNPDHDLMEQYENIDLFINICALYAQKFNKECIDLIDIMDDQGGFQPKVVSRYIESFQWRDPDFISIDNFIAILEKYPQMLSIAWNVLIGNSVKIEHPLNADFLHQQLLGYSLTQRDYLWTIYINGSVDNDRIVQLVQLYNQGKNLKIANQKQIELLLTLFTWFLTSSNRWLRDCTSKAMIEILKNHFQLCEGLLKKFAAVDDPYVAQRLYGIVFGACCKRKEKQIEVYQHLAEYIYTTIFAQQEVYPDILLRDYARLIIERFLLEKPKYQGEIGVEQIQPPYHSQPIPMVEEQYDKRPFSADGIGKIIHSMRFENMGFYGDFGRYVFQAKLRSFTVDQKNIYNYAIHFILQEIGYKNELFAQYDSIQAKYNSYPSTQKIERIGKKYQWIAMYNILARVTDHYDMLSDNRPGKRIIPFVGACKPYVRDFDPTLNNNFMQDKTAPFIQGIDEFLQIATEENKQVGIKGGEQQQKWLKENGCFLQNLQSVLLLTDTCNVKWVALTSYYSTFHDAKDFHRLQTSGSLYAYFITQKQKEALLALAEKKTSLINYETASHNETYTLFNREYPWSANCDEVKEHAWIDPDLEGVEGTFLHATTNRLWEQEFDASKENPISWSVVCHLIIETLHLKQMEADGFYYDSQGNLATYDLALTQGYQSVVIRQDLLDEFLAEKNMELVWLADCEKEIHNEETYAILAQTKWNGIYVYQKGTVEGELYPMDEEMR